MNYLELKKKNEMPTQISFSLSSLEILVTSKDNQFGIERWIKTETPRLLVAYSSEQKD